MSIRIIHGDCLDVLSGMPDASVDSVVTDPPYHLTAGKKGGSGDASINPSSPAGRAMISTGFMGQQWDGGDIAFRVELWAEVCRVMKPGGHLVSFGGTRTYHRMACAIEDAGFEIRDQLSWIYGSGFPKSQNVSKGLDRAAGAKGNFGKPKSAAHAGWIDRGRMRGAEGHEGYQRPWMQDEAAVDQAAREYIPATDLAKQWDGWGTALKPAHEPICLARKPLIGTVAANVAAHGTGAINVDECRVKADAGDYNHPGDLTKRPMARNSFHAAINGDLKVTQAPPNDAGRWPANVCHDGSPEVLEAFARFGERIGFSGGGRRDGLSTTRNVLSDSIGNGGEVRYHADSGTAARFFFCGKASRKERGGSTHPTVKPLALMQWLCRLITPPGGTVLDPFAGSGSTGIAADREGFNAILIEREAEYIADIHRRVNGDAGMFAELTECA